MGAVSKITAKGQTTLPAEIRAALGVTPGDRLRYRTLSDGSVVIEKAPDLSDLRGILKTKLKISSAKLDRMIGERRGRG
jgi:AbrB family looped-hinge helix DNA binding protein